MESPIISHSRMDRTNPLLTVPAVPGRGRYPVLLDDRYHPVPSADNWVQLGQLVILLLMATIGTLCNIYTISCCIVGDRLRKKGNVFIVNLALLMTLNTLFVLPSLGFHIMSGVAVSSTVCGVHEAVSALSGCVSLFTLLVIAIESHVRTFRRQLSCTLAVCWPYAALIICWLTGATLYIILPFASLPNSSCLSVIVSENPALRSITGSIHNSIPLTVIGGITIATCIIYTQIWLRLRRPNCCSCACHGSGDKGGGRRRPLPVMQWDREITRANAAVWLSFVLCWSPAAIVYLTAPHLRIEPALLKSLRWPPLAHASLFNLFYIIFSEDFRESYVNLMRYCCFKVSVDFSKRLRSDIPRPTLSETRKKPTGRGQNRSNFRIQTSVTCARPSSARASSRSGHDGPTAL